MTARNAMPRGGRARPAWALALLWIAATFVGMLIFFIPIGAIQIAMGLDRLEDPARAAELTAPVRVLAAMLCGAGMGLTIGGAQWLVLRRELPRTGWWVAATMAGYAAVGLLALIGNAVQPGWLDWAITLIVNGKMHWLARVETAWQAAAWAPGALTLTLGGAALGLAQWLVLRGRVHGAGWWVAVSTTAWALAAVLSVVESDFWVVTFTSDVPIVATAIGMAWLLRGGQQVARANP